MSKNSTFEKRTPQIERAVAALISAIDRMMGRWDCVAPT
jgi:hypothetical protein